MFAGPHVDDQIVVKRAAKALSEPLVVTEFAAPETTMVPFLERMVFNRRENWTLVERLVPVLLNVQNDGLRSASVHQHAIRWRRRAARDSLGAKFCDAASPPRIVVSTFLSLREEGTLGSRIC